MDPQQFADQIDKFREGRIRTDRPGIAFADLNGLKRVNDRHGHAEGDRMPKNGAAVLRQVFAGDEIYRAAGCCVIRDSGEIRDALQKADERMYQDKEAYYHSNPELRR